MSTVSGRGARHASACSMRPRGSPSRSQAARRGGAARGPARRPTTSTTCSCSAWAAAASPATCWPPSPALHAGADRRDQGLRAPVVRGPGTLVLRRVVLGQHRGDPRGGPGGRGGRRPHGRGDQRRASSPSWPPTWQAPHVPLPDDIPMPRAALGALSVPLIVRPRARRPVPRGVGVDRRRRRAARGPARPRWRPATSAARIARRIGRTLPLVYGAGAARRRGRARGGRPRSTRTPRSPAFTGRVPRAVPQRDRAAGASTAT